MIEETLLTFAMNNGTGVLFGCLMWYQANTTIKSNTAAIRELKQALNKL